MSKKQAAPEAILDYILTVINRMRVSEGRVKRFDAQNRSVSGRPLPILRLRKELEGHVKLRFDD